MYVLYLLLDVRGLVTVRVGIFSSTPLVIVSRLFFFRPFRLVITCSGGRVLLVSGCVDDVEVS